MAFSRYSPYHELKFVVQCQERGKPFYETIAAFNVDTVAQAYSGDCALTNPFNSYRVKRRNASGKFVDYGS